MSVNHADDESLDILDDDSDEINVEDDRGRQVRTDDDDDDASIDRVRSPGSSSACNSLEWDTHADDLFLHAAPALSSSIRP